MDSCSDYAAEAMADTWVSAILDGRLPIIRTIIAINACGPTRSRQRLTLSMRVTNCGRLANASSGLGDLPEPADRGARANRISTAALNRLKWHCGHCQQG